MPDKFTIEQVARIAVDGYVITDRETTRLADAYLQTRAALEEYGRHMNRCRKGWLMAGPYDLHAMPTIGGTHPCDCGLDATLAWEEQG